MDDTLRSLYQERVIDLERRQREIRARRYQERKAGALSVRKGRALAFAYYLAHKEESRARDMLGYAAPRPLPRWVLVHTDHTLLEYIAFGGTAAEFVTERLDGASIWGHTIKKGQEGAV